MPLGARRPATGGQCDHQGKALAQIGVPGQRAAQRATAGRVERETGRA